MVHFLLAYSFRLSMKCHTKPKNLQIFSIYLVQIVEMLNTNKTSENVNKREFFKNFFSTWKFNHKATSYTIFKILGWHLQQKMNFIRIHVIFDPKWFSRPGAAWEQIFLPLLVPMVSTIIGPMIFLNFAEIWNLPFLKCPDLTHSLC